MRSHYVTVLEQCLFDVKFSRILFATDLSDSFQEGFDFALDIARQTASELIVFHSIEPLPLGYGVLVPGIDTEEKRKQHIEEARTKLANIESEGIRAGIKISTKLAQGPAAEKLLAALDDLAAELIIMTVQDRGIIERAVLGSTAERIGRDAKVPVLSFSVNAKSHSGDIMERQNVLDSQGLSDGLTEETCVMGAYNPNFVVGTRVMFQEKNHPGNGQQCTILSPLRNPSQRAVHQWYDVRFDDYSVGRFLQSSIASRDTQWMNFKRGMHS